MAHLSCFVFHLSKSGFGRVCVCVLCWCALLRVSPSPPPPSARNVDDVHDIMDDLQEQNEIAEEIQNAISQPIGFGMELDEVSVCGGGGSQGGDCRSLNVVSLSSGSTLIDLCVFSSYQVRVESCVSERVSVCHSVVSVCEAVPSLLWL